MSPAESISAILEGQTPAIIGGDSGWISRIGGLNDDGKVVACLDQPGRGAEAGIGVNYPAVQILVQGLKYTETYNKCQDIFNCLHAIPTSPERVAQFPELVSCLIRGGIAPLGQDSKSRFLFSINFNLITAPQNPGHRN